MEPNIPDARFCFLTEKVGFGDRGISLNLEAIFDDDPRLLGTVGVLMVRTPRLYCSGAT
jgi:hypothetical protein